jgi:peptidoglycan/LPS O-acetylase OafA/YrhL
MNRIKVLDSARGLAALVVVFHHVFTRLGNLFDGISHTKMYSVLAFISNLNVQAVLFFFLLSGFSIRLSLKNGMPVNKVLLNEYLYKRFKRILPLYFLAIIFTFVCGLLTHSVDQPEYSLRNLIGNSLFLQTPQSYKGYWFSSYGTNGPLWSLSFEMFYYLFFPPFIFLMMKIFRKTSLGSRDQQVVLLISFILSVACTALNNLVFIPYIAFAKLFFIWYLGFFMANLFLEKKLKLDVNFLVCLSFVALSGALFFLKRSDSLLELFKGTILSCGVYFLFIARKKIPVYLIDRTEKVFNFLFYQLGKGSYALYLLHFPIIIILQRYQNINIAAVILVISLLAIACNQLEEFFVKKKFTLLRLRYVR